MKIYENAVTHATIEVHDDVIVEGDNWQPVQSAEQPLKKGGEKGGKKEPDEDEQE